VEASASSWHVVTTFPSSSEVWPWKSVLTSRTRLGLPPNALDECSNALWFSCWNDSSLTPSRLQ
jgi:hypothetical protein